MNKIATNCDSIAFKLESENIDDYLKNTQIINFESKNIEEKVHELINGIDNPIDQIKTIYQFVRDEIPHSMDINSDLVPCNASDVLNSKTGICYAKSHLLAAMLRKINIPTGFCYQKMLRGQPSSGFVIHGLNAFCLKSINKWILLDAGGESVNHGEFNLNQMQIAYGFDESKGEKIYSTICYKPNDSVIKVLNKYKSRSEMWDYLPSSLLK